MKKIIVAVFFVVMTICMPFAAFAASYTETEVTGLGDGFFWEMGNFSEGMCAVTKYGDEYGYVNSEGKLVIGFNYSLEGFGGASAEFSEGVARTVINDKICFIDKTGKVVLSTPYTYSAHSSEYFWANTSVFGCAAFHEGRACIVGDNGKWGFIDKSGKAITAFEYGAGTKFINGKAYIGGNIIDINGNKLLPQNYQRIEDQDDGSLYCYKITYLEGEAGFFSGQPHVTDSYDIYDANFNFVENVQVNETHIGLPDDFFDFTASLKKYGLDENRYSSAADYWGNGIVKAELKEYTTDDNLYELLDAATGKVFEASPFSIVEDFNDDGVSVVIKNKTENGVKYTRMGAVDTKGNLLVPFNYNPCGHADKFNNGLILVQRASDNKLVVLKLTGIASKAVVLPQSYNANPSLTKIITDSENTNVNAYNIGGYNFYKIRDLQYVCANTDCAFTADWNEAKQAIELTTGAPETFNNISIGALTQKNAVPSNATLYKDGEMLSLTAYNIDGYTYFKLRDIGVLFGFEPIWNENDGSITLKCIGDE